MINIKICTEAFHVEGYEVTINKDYADTDIRSFVSSIDINQQGSGTPSANNVRPFVLYDRVAVMRNGHFLGLRYFDERVVQGELDVLNGTFTTEWDYIEAYDGEPITTEWMSDRDVYAVGTLPTLGAEVIYRNPKTMSLGGIEAPLNMGTNTFRVDFHGDIWQNGVGEGDSISFESDGNTQLEKLLVTLEPIQEGTPWIGETNTEPYLIREVDTDGNSEYDTLIGGTVAWNQLVPNTNKTTTTSNGITFTVNADGSVTLNGTATADATFNYGTVNVVKGHKYAVVGIPSGASSTGHKVVVLGTMFADTIRNMSADDYWTSRIIVTSGTTVTNVRYNPLCIDLTLMLGSTIADYVYSLEQGTAGAGVAWLKSHFDCFNSYQPYSSGEIKSVEGLESHEMVGFNQWDEEWELGNIDSTSGGNTSSTTRIRSKNYIPVLPNTEYFFKSPANTFGLRYYDANKTYIGGVSASANSLKTLPADCRFLRFTVVDMTTYNHNICINISDASKNGQYEPYIKHSYPLDSSLTLRGIYKMDANHNLYADGDVYASDGTVTRKYGVVDLGTLNWGKYSDSYPNLFVANDASIKKTGGSTILGNAISSQYAICTETQIGGNGYTDGYFAISGTNSRVYVNDIRYTSASDFKTAVTGQTLVYELATPTTETADPYTSPQTVYDGGTEEYVTTSIIPVGHESRYLRIAPISGHDFIEISHIDEVETRSYLLAFAAMTCISKTCDSVICGKVYCGTFDVLTSTVTSECGYIASYNGEPMPLEWISDRDEYEEGTLPSIGAEVVYRLEEPIVYHLQNIPSMVINPHEGSNNYSSQGNQIFGVWVDYVGETTDRGYSDITYAKVIVLEGEVCGKTNPLTITDGVRGFVLCKTPLCENKLCPSTCDTDMKVSVCGEDALHVSECD